MLVLTRKANEEITIGEHVRLVVLGVRGNRVRLGVIASDDVEIHRAEVDLPEFCGGKPVVKSATGKTYPPVEH